MPTAEVMIAAAFVVIAYIPAICAARSTNRNTNSGFMIIRISNLPVSKLNDFIESFGEIRFHKNYRPGGSYLVSVLGAGVPPTRQKAQQRPGTPTLPQPIFSRSDQRPGSRQLRNKLN
jgi:hypothetical protein